MNELRQIRRKQRLTLEALGYLAGVDPATISRIERGEVVPKPRTVVAIAEALGVSVTRIAPKTPSVP